MIVSKHLWTTFVALTCMIVVPLRAEPIDNTSMSEAVLQARLDDLQQANAQVPGFAIAMIKGGERFSAATGVSGPDQTPMTAQTPFRLASVTKTFVAAAILRLHEQGQLDLDSAISAHVSADHLNLLRADGYDVDAITIRQLLMHASGLNDHFGTDEMRAMVFAEPDRVWTASEQIRLMVDATQPIGEPGKQFAYSDTGFVLLGEIIERISGKPLGQAVRELNRFETLGIGAMRWEGEQPADGTPDRAHQWISGFDTYALDGSVDGFGGGGLVGNVTDTAIYYDALFGGSVYSKASTLKLMQDAPLHPHNSPYRVGLFTDMIGGEQAFMHGGFWGIFAVHVPSQDLTIVSVALDQSGDAAMRQFVFEMVDLVRLS